MSELAPERTEISAPYWDGLEEGALRFQRCRSCGHAWLPPRAECPQCLAADAAWETACGEATLISWTIYHIAYHAAFKDRVPYNVAIVQLAEGPRLISNVRNPERGLRADAQLRLAIGRSEGIALPYFDLVEA